MVICLQTPEQVHLALHILLQGVFLVHALLSEAPQPFTVNGPVVASLELAANP